MIKGTDERTIVWGLNAFEKENQQNERQHRTDFTEADSSAKEEVSFGINAWNISRGCAAILIENFAEVFSQEMPLCWFDDVVVNHTDYQQQKYKNVSIQDKNHPNAG